MCFKAFIRPSRNFPFALSCVVALAFSNNTYAQKTVVNAMVGMELRYHGDTIWRWRDTTMVRTVFRGDTVIRSSFVNDVATNSMTYVITGDVASVVELRNGTGAALPAGAGATSPATTLMAERDLFTMSVRQKAAELQSAQMFERMASSGASLPEMPSFMPPRSPADLRKYPFSPNTTIFQHGDTVRYVHGCAAIPRTDTTIYVILASDSLRRVTPNPRTFNHMMTSAVLADMTSVLLRQYSAARDVADPLLPGPRKWACDLR